MPWLRSTATSSPCAEVLVEPASPRAGADSRVWARHSLAFPCNQFGHQTNEGNDEFLNTLKYVRPGDGFEPAETITVFGKGDVNGENAMPLFKWLKACLLYTSPSPRDRQKSRMPSSA